MCGNARELPAPTSQKVIIEFEEWTICPLFKLTSRMVDFSGGGRWGGMGWGAGNARNHYLGNYGGLRRK